MLCADRRRTEPLLQTSTRDGFGYSCHRPLTSAPPPGREVSRLLTETHQHRRLVRVRARRSLVRGDFERGFNVHARRRVVATNDQN